ncbi:unnamed protein product [[Candida] boidinii]|uniref:tRNA(Ile)-lysidine synthetase n=1 Tax=Candida boidinii TaxID=5477 RepID=A0A9W6WJU2_CANBO|nr:unnamed protein product [[Candida] boidinii]GMF99452.1 unnamed protein product [[Candida] boidinii]
MIEKIFTNNIKKIFKNDINYNSNNKFPLKIAVAVSGGVDSMVLLKLLNNFTTKNKLNTEIYAITINHNLRPESYEESKLISKEIKNSISNDIKHIIIEINWNKYKDINEIKNIEEIARDKRYFEFQKKCYELNINYLFLGHHLNDQIETFLLRLKKNSLLFGLNCMKFISNFPLIPKYPNNFKKKIQIIRPLLNIEKISIIDYCQLSKIKWFEDYTNKDINLTFRNFIRNYYELKKDSNELAKDKIIDSIYQINEFNDNINNEIKLIKIELNNTKKIILILNDLNLIIKLPKFGFINKYSINSINRFLFKEFYKISPTNNYYLKYSRIDNFDSSIVINDTESNNKKSMARIIFDEEYLNGDNNVPINKGRRVKRLSILECDLTIDYDTDENDIILNIKRSNPKTNKLNETDIELNNGNNNQWFLFDNRFWFKINFENNKELENSELKIRLFNKNDFNKLELNGFVDYVDKDNFKISNLLNIPMLLLNNRIIGFPTIDLISYKYRDLIDIEWTVKSDF